MHKSIQYISDRHRRRLLQRNRELSYKHRIQKANKEQSTLENHLGKSTKASNSLEIVPQKQCDVEKSSTDNITLNNLTDDIMIVHNETHNKQFNWEVDDGLSKDSRLP